MEDKALNNLSDIMKIEKTIGQMLEEIKENILNDINNAKIDNTISISNNISIVKFSNLKDNIWSPEYYIGNAQMKYIAKKFANIVSTKQMIDTINEIITTKSILINKNKYPINPKIIDILIKYKGEN